MSSVVLKRVKVLENLSQWFVSRLIKNPPNLQNKHYSIKITCRSALVTGGAKGAGYYIAESLLDHGLQNVILLDSVEKHCEEAAEKLNKRYGGPRVLPCKCDVTNLNDLETIFNRINDKYLDILINSSNIDDGLNIERTLRTNLKGIVNGTLLGFKYLKAGGCIINMSSIHGLQPFYASPIYSGTQFFTIGFTRSVGSDYFYNKTKVKVMALCQGITNSDLEHQKTYGMPLLPGLGDSAHCFPIQEPEEVGKCVLAMLEDSENGSIWVAEENECYKCFLPDRHDFQKLPINTC